MQTKIILYLTVLVLVLAGAIGINSWHELKVQEAFNNGKAQANLEFKASENLSLKNLQERVNTLIQENKVTQNEKLKLENEIKQFRTRDTSTSGLRKQRELEFQADVARATAENLRRAATALDGHLTGSREHVKRFGLEAAECSRTATIQRRDLDNWEKALTGSLPELPPLPNLPK